LRAARSALAGPANLQRGNRHSMHRLLSSLTVDLQLKLGAKPAKAPDEFAQ
jgi:hypothetical protein